MFERLKYKRDRKAEIASLGEHIDKEFKAAADVAGTPQEKSEAEQFAFSMCQWEMKQIDCGTAGCSGKAEDSPV